MTIYEKIFNRLAELHMSQSDLSRATGIPASTISDWRKKKINPQSDKLVSICKALNMSLVDLLCDEDGADDKENVSQIDYSTEEKQIIESYRNISGSSREQLMRYIELFLFSAESGLSEKWEKSKRNVSVIQDLEGKNIVVIHDIRFKGKRAVNWKDVREYLKEYVGDFYTIAATGDVIYVGSDLPREYAGSEYTNRIRGTNAKAKANAAQGIPELIEISEGKYHRFNMECKHKRDAKNGWYRYDSRFALPVYDAKGEVERYNIFHASMLIRHSNDGKMYLYDVIDIKKETSNPLGS